MEPLDLRQQIDVHTAAGEALPAARLLAEYWRSENTSAAAGFVVSRFEKIRERLPLLRYRLAILRSFTVEPMVALLRAMAFTAGIDLEIRLSEFNAYAQEMLDPAGPLYAFRPDAVILAVQTRDAVPSLWRGADDAVAAVDRAVADFHAWIQAFRAHTAASLIVHTLEQPAVPAQGIMDAQGSGQAAAIRRINDDLREIAAAHHGVYLLDYDALVARHGRQSWHDERKWLAVRLPVAARHLAALAREWMRFLHPLTGKLAKVLAVDLDNTLWGGIIGEDGMAGIQLGPEYPGAAYQELQRAMLDLYHRGILLAVCSKNNPDDALEALAGHPGMILKPEQFASVRINWAEKAQNLHEIAAELNVGIDAVAFLDDNPVECRHVRGELPEVTVIELPKDLMEYARTLRDCPVLERLALSEEDRRRGLYYAAERQRTELQRTLASPEDFYRSLEQEAEIEPVNSMTLARVAQLTQKTNQFNLTTRRYTEQQISELAARPGWEVWSIRVRDRYADNGLVGVAITRLEGEVCEIDTFLLSCRVIGRTVETALLAHLAADARRRGATRLQGWFLTTKKNAPARDFYAAHGFQPVKNEAAGSLWERNLTADLPACPEWVKVAVAETSACT